MQNDLDRMNDPEERRLDELREGADRSSPIVWRGWLTAGGVAVGALAIGLLVQPSTIRAAEEVRRSVGQDRTLAPAEPGIATERSPWAMLRFGDVVVEYRTTSLDHSAVHDAIASGFQTGFESEDHAVGCWTVTDLAGDTLGIFHDPAGLVEAFPDVDPTALAYRALQNIDRGDVRD